MWARIHLPIAKKCNVKCIFCDHNNGSSCHTAKPGYASRLMTPEEAIDRTLREMQQDNNLKIIAISGPGEPLFNEATFAFLKEIRKRDIDSKLCLSTNGVLLEESALTLARLGVDSVSVSMSALNPIVVSKIYEWAIINGVILRDLEMASQIIPRQLEGIKYATELGIAVKVNTILMQGINNQEIGPLSKKIAEAGAILQNIVPVIQCGNNPNLIMPELKDIMLARQIGSRNIPQFTHCKQCRSDVVGIPGEDRIL